jgi:Zn-dependent peptidase ImmA (M78 family)
VKPVMTKWSPELDRLEAAAGLAEAIVQGLDITKPPVSPFAVIKAENRQVLAFGDDFGDAFDGRLEYQSPKFLLFYNTKYDEWPHTGEHHPRVTFTVAHELGHYFLERHRQYLKKGGGAHCSQTEFLSDNLSEREADTFAASLLMPSFLARPIVNKNELTLARLDTIARSFETSLVSTTIRAVRLSEYPCAVAGIREGQIAWMFPSDRLIEGSCYPGKRVLESPQAKERWQNFVGGSKDRASGDGMARHWFQMYDREDELHDVYVTEEFLPVQVMNTLVVLVTLDDDDLFKDDKEDEEEDEIDRNHHERFGW